eukprot:scaffold12109_cov87-Cylindrotheca_fusiformis.AAC.2
MYTQTYIQHVSRLIIVQERKQREFANNEGNKSVANFDQKSPLARERRMENAGKQSSFKFNSSHLSAHRWVSASPEDPGSRVNKRQIGNKSRIDPGLGVNFPSHRNVTKNTFLK